VKHGIANDPEMPDGDRAIAERPSLSGWGGRQSPRQRPEFGD
jgi:hypothetical protein